MVLRGIFKDNLLYIKLWRNQIEVIDVEKNISVREKSNTPFSNSRLIISEFLIAESFFKKVFLRLKKNYKIKRYDTILVHPMELNEGGISEVEKRIFMESFERVGARRILIWEGRELSNREVLKKFGK